MPRQPEGRHTPGQGERTPHSQRLEPSEGPGLQGTGTGESGSPLNMSEGREHQVTCSRESLPCARRSVSVGRTPDFGKAHTATCDAICRVSLVFVITFLHTVTVTVTIKPSDICNPIRNTQGSEHSGTLPQWSGMPGGSCHSSGSGGSHSGWGGSAPPAPGQTGMCGDVLNGHGWGCTGRLVGQGRGCC